MKTTKLISILFLIMLMQSCTKDNEPCGGNETYNYLSTEDKAKVPYTGTDTLVFVSNTNDTAVCIGQGKKRFYTVKYLSVRAGECQNDAYYYEAYNYKFKDNKNLLDISLNIFKYDLDNFEVISIDIKDRTHGTLLSYLVDKHYSNFLINGYPKRGLMFCGRVLMRMQRRFGS
jgi:hypothetical protein